MKEQLFIKQAGRKMAKKKQPTVFIDAQRMHLEHPTTFEVPSQEELDAIQPGMFVKVCVETNDKKIKTERFWTEVVKVDGEKIEATVANMLIASKLQHGETINFEKKNIYSVQ